MKIIRILLLFLALPSIGHAGVIVSDISKATENENTTFSVALSVTNPQTDITQLVFSVTNTTDNQTGGFLTAFAFNTPGSVIPDSAYTPSPQWSFLGGPINTSPFDDLDYGFSISKSFQGGGNPNSGLAPSETLNFGVLLNGAYSLSDLTAFYQKPAINFVARFRGLNDGGSNKVPGFSTVPEPSSLALMVLGLLGILTTGLRHVSRQ